MSGIMSMVVNNVATVAAGPAYVTTNLQLYYEPSTSYSGSGSTITDLSGNGFNGTIYNSPTYSSPYFTYNGSNTYIQTPNMVSKFNNTTSVSIEIWVYAAGASMALVENGNTGDPTAGWTYNQMYLGPTFGAIRYAWATVWNGTSVPSVGAGTASINYNTWYHVVLTYNGTNVISYLNKTPGTSTAVSRQVPWVGGTSPNNGYVLSIGAHSPTSFTGGSVNNVNFNGRIGLIRAYNRALTSSEVTQNYDANKALYGL